MVPAAQEASKPWPCLPRHAPPPGVLEHDSLDMPASLAVRNRAQDRLPQYTEAAGADDISMKLHIAASAWVCVPVCFT
jgi:hypothetical protein